jgi:hypothetical protein
MRGRLRSAFVLAAALLGGCLSLVPPAIPPPPRRDINAVLASHDRQLLQLPGVVGVYVGLADDQRTPCLRVMLASPNPALLPAIPRELEGYAVITEVTGEIRPLSDRR